MKNPKEIGQLLKEARRKKGLNTEGVYKATRIQPHIVDLLEQGRADEALSRIYILSFLKKYAFFLDLDGEALAADYKKFYTRAEKQILSLNEEPLIISAETQKWMTFAITAGVALLLVFFILFLGINLRAARSVRRVPERKPVPLRAAPRKESPFPIPEKKSIELTLEGTDDVWMKVKKDGKKVFEGTLRKNEEKRISAEEEIELWAGRAEALKFTINGRPIGKVGKGSIKNIRISRRELTVGSKRLFGAD